MLRALFGSLTIVAAFGAPAFAAGPLSEDIPVPGGTVALSRAIGLETPPDRPRFVSELARLMYGLPEGHSADPSSRLRRLTAHLDAAEQFRAALGDIPDGALTLTLAADTQHRDGLRHLLELVALRVRESRGQYSVEPTTDKAAVARVPLLIDLGVDLNRLASRLNAGETVHLTLPTELVPIPLNAAMWSDVVLRRPVTAGNLFAAVLSESRTALLAYGLAGLDDETLAYVSDSRQLLERLAGGDMPAMFAACAGSVRVRAGRMIAPGGDAAIPVWEAVVGEKVTRPDAFIRELLTRGSGRLAYVYDLIAELDAGRSAFALGLWMPEERDRIARFRSLVAAADALAPEWQLRDTPFARPLDDLAWLLLNVRVEANGTPAQPAALLFWTRALEGADVPDAGDASRMAKDIVTSSDTSIDAAWLAEVALAGDRTQRASRIQQLAFGFRAFGPPIGSRREAQSQATSDAIGAMIVTIRALPSYPALVLTLERMGVADPIVYAAAARQAQRLSDVNGAQAHVALNQFQGAIALLARMTETGGIEPHTAESLVAKLVAIPLGSDGEYGPAIARWTRREWLPVLAARDSAEQTLIAALAGATASTAGGTERVTWEGEPYRLDLPAAEERRLRQVRDRQRARPVDAALSLEQIAGTLGTAAPDMAAVHAAIASLESLQTMSPTLATDAGAIVARAIRDLTTVTKAKNTEDAARVAQPLFELSGVMLGESLSSLAYATVVGDPSESPLAGTDLARRHDFGLAAQTVKRQTAWLVPRQVVETGGPRHVLGSLLGLDVAFAQVALRRVSLEGAGTPPVLLSNERETFTASVALLNPRVLRNVDRDAIATAIARGRERIDAVARGSAPLDSMASAIKLDGWRRRAAQWDIAHDPDGVRSLFSLNEALVLGSGDAPDAASSFHAWGMADIPVSGCLCTRLAPTNAWRIVGGRPQLGVLSTAMADVNLHVAVTLAALKLPASLARVVLGAAVQEFVDRVRPNDPGDWLTLVRAAREAPRERIEDYVAAATAIGPLLPESSYARIPR